MPEIEIKNNWIASEPCPPRSGPGQNLAGSINAAPEMAATAIHACSFARTPEPAEPPLQALRATRSTADLIRRDGAGVAREIDRLLAHLDGERVFTVLDTDSGFVQCQPDPEQRAIYCEFTPASGPTPLDERTSIPQRY